ncbi:transmembrane protease serine 11G-like [Hyperolius riggenbachi]|uniref:transmembrane protease serine 11G-like n=1 Tax=Hyperolius riggenbachi TaxID=752182 RepID=UPI0035A39294
MLEAAALIKLKQWKKTIIILSLVGLLILAGVIAAIVIAVVLETKKAVPSTPHYYDGALRINNLSYRNAFNDSSSAEFRALSSQIEENIRALFDNSVLKRHFSMSNVIALRPGVLVAFILQFQVPNAESEKYSTFSVENIFKENLKNSFSSRFLVDESSVQLSGK